MMQRTKIPLPVSQPLFILRLNHLLQPDVIRSRLRNTFCHLDEFVFIGQAGRAKMTTAWTELGRVMGSEGPIT